MKETIPQLLSINKQKILISVKRRKKEKSKEGEKMSSWIPSLFTPNRDPSSDYDNPTSPTSSSPNKTPKTPSSGVKEDLSAAFRGVAAFLAPSPATLISEAYSSSSDAIAGIKNDLVEIQGSFKSGLSLISSKFTSNFLQFQRQLNDDDDEVEEEEYIVGITEEVVDFVRKLSARPELWIDFPLSLSDDFDLSDYQREHAAYIDHLVPELVTLRQKIDSQISDLKFWIIYFVLLFPRLNEEDLKLLSTPQVVDVRETLLTKLQNKSNTNQDTSENPETSDANKDSGKGSITEGDENELQRKDTSSEIVNATRQMINVTNMESEHISEEEAESCMSVDALKQSENEEDISFSDLEDDDNDLSEKLSVFKVSNSNNILPGETNEWIQLNENSGTQGGQKTAYQSGLRDKESEGEDSNGWLAVDDNDFDI